MPRPLRGMLAATPLLVLATACDPPASAGPATSIVVAAPQPTWSALRPTILAALEPRTSTVRDERIFAVGYVDPSSPDWSTLRRGRQLLLIGRAADPWVAEALPWRDRGATTPPEVVRLLDVWARPQSVTIVVLPPDGSLDSAAAALPGIGTRYVAELAERARERMFASGERRLDLASGPGTGFSLRLPRVYRVEELGDEILVMTNDQPDPARLIRQIAVASRPISPAPLSAEAAWRWRAELAAATTRPQQVTDSAFVIREVEVGGRRLLELESTWSNPAGEWPAGGPSIARVVECAGRRFLLDGWVYAPGRPKFEYLVQIRTILDSFRCAV